MAFDEKGQADTLERKTSICQRAYDILVDQVGFPPEDIIFDPNIFAIATGIEEHDRYGLDYIEATRWIREHLPARTCRAACRTCRSRSVATRRSARRCTRCSSSTPSGPGWTWASSTPVRWPCTTISIRSCARRARTSCSTAGPTAPNACWRSPSATATRRASTASRSGVARALGREAPLACAGARRHRLRHRRRRGGTARRGTAARRDRGPADGRHEHRRRPVRQRADVPAPGGEVGAGDEAGGGPPASVHGRRGRPAGHPGKPAAKIVMATVKGDVHDIGKNIVGVVLQCNNYEVIDLGVMVPVDRIIETARAERGGHHRALRPDHPVARRDVPRRLGDGAPGSRRPVADRRGHDEPGPHRGQDPPQLPARPGRARARRQPGRRCRGGAAVRRSAPGVHRRDPRRIRPARGSRTPGDAGPRPGPRSRTHARTRSCSIRRRHPSAPTFIGTKRLHPLLGRRPRRGHRLVAVLPNVGSGRPLPGDLRRRALRRSCPLAVRRRPPDARPHRRRRVVRHGRRRRLLAGRVRRRRHRHLRRRVAAPATRRVPHAAPADDASATAGPTWRWPTSSATGGRRRPHRRVHGHHRRG